MTQPPPPVPVTVKGAALRGITCERCGCQYLYRLTREITRRSRTPAPEAPDPARAARKVLKRELKWGIDPVPCPDCGYLQRAMVRRIKLEKAAVLILIFAGSAAFNGLFFLLAYVGVFSMAVPEISTVLAMAPMPFMLWVTIQRNHNTPQQMESRLQPEAPLALRRKDFPELPAELFDDTAPA